MIRNEKNGILFYRFESLARFPEIRHGFFTRIGGVSPAPFQSLNVGFDVGDDPGRVRENRRRIAACFGGEPMVFTRQIHGALVRFDTGQTNSDAAFGRNGPNPADALITHRPRRNLVIQVADCQAVLLYDPVRKIVANIHAGWRGSIGNIIGKTVMAMENRFGSRPADIVAGIGPSLGPCCAEFVNFKREIPEMFWRYGDSKNRFDFWALSTDQLCRAGLKPDHIELSGWCTRCRSDLFFSYRKEGMTGRMAAVIGLR